MFDIGPAAAVTIDFCFAVLFFFSCFLLIFQIWFLNTYMCIRITCMYLDIGLEQTLYMDYIMRKTIRYNFKEIYHLKETKSFLFFFCVDSLAPLFVFSSEIPLISFGGVFMLASRSPHNKKIRNIIVFLSIFFIEYHKYTAVVCIYVCVHNAMKDF